MTVMHLASAMKVAIGITSDGITVDGCCVSVSQMPARRGPRRHDAFSAALSYSALAAILPNERR